MRHIFIVIAFSILLILFSIPAYQSSLFSYSAQLSGATNNPSSSKSSISGMGLNCLQQCSMKKFVSPQCDEVCSY
jgi:hypothetical protein